MNRSCEGAILLVGEGDFSLTVSLRGLKELKDTHITATSLLTRSEIQLHKYAEENIRELENDGVEVQLGVDATLLSSVPTLHGRLFQRIIFNFPHVGGKSNIKKNRQLLKDFFKSACTVLEPGGEVCVTLARGQGGTPADHPMRSWKDSWQIVAMAAYADLILSETEPFTPEVFPEYSSTGFRSQDRHFHTDGAVTHIFIQAKPVEVLLPSENLVTEISFDGNDFVVGRYIANRFNRKLLNNYQHPLGLTKRHLEENLPGIAHANSVVVVESSQLPIVLPRAPDGKVITCRYYIYPQDTKLSAINGPVQCLPAELPTNMEKDLLLQTNSCMESSFNCVDTPTLRTTLLENLSDKVVEGDNTLYIASGDVYRRCSIKVNELPVQHEMVGYTDLQFHTHLPTLVQNLIQSIIPSQLEISLEKFEHGEVDIPPWVTEYVTVTQVITVLNVPSLNHTDAAVHANISKPQAGKNSQFCPKEPLGYLGSLKPNQQCSLFVLNLDLLSQIAFNIPEARLLWTDNTLYLSQFQKMTTKMNCKPYPASLYPPLWTHDISFWLNKERTFDEMEYFDIVRNFAGDCIKEGILMNTWTPPGTTDVSKCYRGIYQSCDQALSHFKAHEIQKNLRLKVADELGVTLR